MATNLTQIVTLLNDGEFHDGPSIGQHLNISRTAVWKVIKKLQKYRVPIQAIKGKGYILQHPLLLLDKEKMEKGIKAKSVHIDLFEQIDSTNDHLKTIHNPSQVNICIAETQTKGKGRFQRPWHSPFGQNIYLSLKYSFNKDISELAGLSLVCGIAVCNSIEETCQLPHPILVKWPNDIICDDKKLAGILIEIEAETHGVCSVIIGIGLNTNMQKDDDKKINQGWTSIKNLTHTYQDRNLLCAVLINQLMDSLICFEKTGFSGFLRHWQKRDYLLNKPIRLKSGEREFLGTGLGVNEQGHLIIKLSDNSQKVFSSGDSTLLK